MIALMMLPHFVSAAGTQVKPTDWAIPPVATKGTVTVPVILVSFDNVARKHARTDYQKLFNGRTSSVSHYYSENSYGKLDLRFDIHIANPLPKDDVHYESDCPYGGASCHQERHAELIKDAVANSNVEWERYDNYGPGDKPDGIVDAVFFVHPESSAQCSKGSTNLHDVQFRYYELPAAKKTLFDTGRKNTGGESIYINDYVLIGGQNCRQDNVTELGSPVHEFGHVLGLPDLQSEVDGAGSIGLWGQMGTGTYGTDDSLSDHLPTHLSAWSKQHLGWITPRVITVGDLGHGQEFSLKAVELSPDAIRMPFPDTNNEIYYLLEHRKRVGYDAELPADGMLIWLVNQTVVDEWLNSYRNAEFYYRVNDNPSRLGIELLEADDRRDMKQAFNAGDSGDVFPGDTGRFHFDGHPDFKVRSLSGDSICGIHHHGDLIKFTYKYRYQCDQ